MAQPSLGAPICTGGFAPTLGGHGHPRSTAGFDDRYSLRGGDAYLNAAAAPDLRPGDQTEMSATCAPESVSRSLVRILTD